MLLQWISYRGSRSRLFVRQLSRPTWREGSCEVGKVALQTGTLVNSTQCVSRGYCGALTPAIAVLFFLLQVSSLRYGCETSNIGVCPNPLPGSHVDVSLTCHCRATLLVQRAKHEFSKPQAAHGALRCDGLELQFLDRFLINFISTSF